MDKENTKDKPVRKLGVLDLKLAKLISDQQGLSGNNQSSDRLESMGLPESPMQLHNIDELKFSKTMDLKEYPSFDFKTLDISVEEIKGLSDDDLLRLLSGEGHDGQILDRTAQLISNELLIRQIKEASKPHWSTTPAFIMASIAAIGTVIAIYISLR